MAAMAILLAAKAAQAVLLDNTVLALAMDLVVNRKALLA
jgi:hypothetical protein